MLFFWEYGKFGVYVARAGRPLRQSRAATTNPVVVPCVTQLEGILVGQSVAHLCLYCAPRLWPGAQRKCDGGLLTLNELNTAVTKWTDGDMENGHPVRSRDDKYASNGQLTREQFEAQCIEIARRSTEVMMPYSSGKLL